MNKIERTIIRTVLHIIFLWGIGIAFHAAFVTGNEAERVFGLIAAFIGYTELGRWE